MVPERQANTELAWSWDVRKSAFVVIHYRVVVPIYAILSGAGTL